MASGSSEPTGVWLGRPCVSGARSLGAEPGSLTSCVSLGGRLYPSVPWSPGLQRRSGSGSPAVLLLLRYCGTPAPQVAVGREERVSPQARSMQGRASHTVQGGQPPADTGPSLPFLGTAWGPRRPDALRPRALQAQHGHFRRGPVTVAENRRVALGTRASPREGRDDGAEMEAAGGGRWRPPPRGRRGPSPRCARGPGAEDSHTEERVAGA